MIDYTSNQTVINHKNLEINPAVKKTFFEAAISFSMTGITSFFIATPGGIGLALGATATLCAINFFIRCFLENQKPTPFYKDLIPALCFSTLYSGTAGTLVHESGHFFTACLLRTITHISITVDPFNGGVTTHTYSGLSTLGKKLGSRVSQILISASGAGATVIVALIVITLANRYLNNHPALQTYLRIAPVIATIDEIFYALTTFFVKDPDGHDFHRLWKVGGIHPLFAAASIALIVAATFALTYKKPKPKPPFRLPEISRI